MLGLRTEIGAVGGVVRQVVGGSWQRRPDATFADTAHVIVDPVGAVWVDPIRIELNDGDSTFIKLFGRDDEDGVIVLSGAWSSTDMTVATVESCGDSAVVKAIGAGTASVIVKLVRGIAIPRTLLHYYVVPIPGVGFTFPAMLASGGIWLQNLFLSDVVSAGYTEMTALVQAYGAHPV